MPELDLQNPVCVLSLTIAASSALQMIYEVDLPCSVRVALSKLVCKLIGTSVSDYLAWPNMNPEAAVLRQHCCSRSIDRNSAWHKTTPLYQLVYHHRGCSMSLLNVEQVSGLMHRDHLPSLNGNRQRHQLTSWLPLQALVALIHITTLHIFPDVLAHIMLPTDALDMVYGLCMPT